MSLTLLVDNAHYRFTDVSGAAGQCFFHALCKSQVAPFSGAKDLKADMQKYCNIIKPFETDGSDFQFEQWKADFSQTNYHGTHYDMVFYSMLYGIEIVCVSAYFSRNNKFIPPVSSYAYYDMLKNANNINIGVLPPKSTTHYIYLHHHMKPCHCFGYYNKTIKQWAWIAPSIYNRNSWSSFNLDHYGQLEPITQEQSVGSFVYSGGPSMQQVNEW